MDRPNRTNVVLTGALAVAELLRTMNHSSDDTEITVSIGSFHDEPAFVFTVLDTTVLLNEADTRFIAASLSDPFKDIPLPAGGELGLARFRHVAMALSKAMLDALEAARDTPPADAALH